MEKLAVQPLFYIFFVYGLSFLLMSYLIIKGAIKLVYSPIIASFYMLAFFGLTHGITEIIDWIRFVLVTLGTGDPVILKYISQIFLVASFVFLLQFGFNLLTYASEKKRIIRAIPLVLFAAFIVTVLAKGITDILKIGLLGRYSFGFTGSLLSAIALLMLGNTMKPLGNQKLLSAVKIAATAFAFYAIFGGLIITPIGGIPVQLFRSACAVAIALSSFAILDVYQYIKSKKEI